jgi:nitrate/nitrite transporter NarK
MLRRSVIAIPLLVAAAGVLFLAPTGELVSQAVRQVFVTNFPAVQEVEGAVAIEGPVHLSRSVKFEDITVPPVMRQDTTRLVEAGVLETEGFPDVILSLHGVVKGHVGRVGTVGAVLIPDETTIQEAFTEQGMLHFFLETAAGDVSSKTPYFASTQPRYTVAFSRYRILLYNTTDKTVSASLFAYLTD